jgi:hypothetical protein
MDRDDAGMPDRNDEARQGDTGMIGSESEEPGPGRDTSLTDPDPVAASTDQPRGTVAMSEGDPMATRLGSHVEGAGVIGYDVAGDEEGATQATQAEDRPGYEAERSGDERDPGLAAEPVVDRGSYAQQVEDTGPTDSAVFADQPVAPERPAFATEDAGAPDRSAVAADDPARFGAGDAMAAPTGYEGEPAGTGTAGHQEEPGVQEGVYDQEADQARQQRPSDGR